MTKTKALKRNHSVTNSSTKKELRRLSTCPSAKKVSRLTHLQPAPSRSKLLSGWFSILTWERTRTSSVKNLKKPPNKRVRTRTRLRSSKSKLRTLSTPLQWSVHSKLWNAWSFKTLNMRNSATTSTTKITLRIQLLNHLALSFLSGDSPQKSLAVRMSLLWHGILVIRICLQLPMVATTSWNKQLV